MTHPQTPQPGDRILVLKKQWLDMILAEEKTMEIRGCNFRPGSYYLGCRGEITGVIELGVGDLLDTEEQWVQLRPRHRVPGSRPYKKTWGLPIQRVAKMDNISYHHPRGAIGIVIVR